MLDVLRVYCIDDYNYRLHTEMPHYGTIMCENKNIQLENSLSLLVTSDIIQILGDITTCAYMYYISNIINAICCIAIPLMP